MRPLCRDLAGARLGRVERRVPAPRARSGGGWPTTFDDVAAAHRPPGGARRTRGWTSRASSRSGTRPAGTWPRGRRPAAAAGGRARRCAARAGDRGGVAGRRRGPAAGVGAAALRAASSASCSAAAPDRGRRALRARLARPSGPARRARAAHARRPRRHRAAVGQRARSPRPRAPRATRSSWCRSPTRTTSATSTRRTRCGRPWWNGWRDATASGAEALDAADPLAGFRERFELGRRAPTSTSTATRSAASPVADARARWRAASTSGATRLVSGWRDWIDLPLRAGDALADACSAPRRARSSSRDSMTVNLYKLACAALDARGPGALVTDRGNFPTDRYVLEGIAAARGARAADASTATRSTGPSPTTSPRCARATSSCSRTSPTARARSPTCRR